MAKLCLFESEAGDRFSEDSVCEDNVCENNCFSNVAATMIGIVWAFDVERKTAKRYSFQFLA